MWGGRVCTLWPQSSSPTSHWDAHHSQLSSKHDSLYRTMAASLHGDTLGASQIWKVPPAVLGVPQVSVPGELGSAHPESRHTA